MKARYETYRDTPETYAVRSILTHSRCSRGRLSAQDARDALAQILRADRLVQQDARAERRRAARLSWLRDDTDHSGF